MSNNDSSAAIAQNGLLDAAAQFHQMKKDPAYLRVLKEMEDTVAKAAPKYMVVNGEYLRLEDEWVTKRLAYLKMMLDSYVQQNYPMTKSSSA